jgi:hypothetical protein
MKSALLVLLAALAAAPALAREQGPSEETMRILLKNYRHCLMRVHYGELDRDRTNSEAKNRALELCATGPLTSHPRMKRVARRFEKEIRDSALRGPEGRSQQKPNKLTKYAHCLVRSYYGRIDELEFPTLAFDEAKNSCQKHLSSLPLAAAAAVSQHLLSKLSDAEEVVE